MPPMPIFAFHFAAFRIHTARALPLLFRAATILLLLSGIQLTGSPSPAVTDLVKRSVASVNCGGKSADGLNPDQPYRNGQYGFIGSTQIVSTNDTVTSSFQLPRALQSARVGLDSKFAYRFDLANGYYFVHLFFAEPESTEINQRIFDLTLNGERILRDFDLVYSAATYNDEIGLWNGFRHGFPARVVDGRLEIAFIPKRGESLINAIIVEPGYEDPIEPCGPGAGQTFAKWPESLKRPLIPGSAESWEGWVLSGNIRQERSTLISGDGRAMATARLAALTSDPYVLDTRFELAKGETEIQIEINDESYLLNLSFGRDAQYALTSDGRVTQASLGRMKIGSRRLRSGPHRCLAMVHQGFAHVYLDGEHLAAFPMPTASGESFVRVSTSSDTREAVRVHDLQLYRERYLFNDDFQDESEGSLPSHWDPQKGTWSVTRDGENSYLRQSQTTGSWETIMHANSRDIQLTARILIPSRTPSWKAGFFLHRSAGHRTFVGYDSDTSRWTVTEFDRDETVGETTISAPSPNGLQWSEWRVHVSGTDIRLYVDNRLQLTYTAQFSRRGLLGFQGVNCSFALDDVVLESEDLVQEGVHFLPMTLERPESEHTLTNQNNLTLYEDDQKLWANFRYNISSDSGARRAVRVETSSRDHGLSWSPPVVSNNGGWTVRVSPTRLLRFGWGRVDDPAQNWGDDFRGVNRASSVQWSDDGGETWSPWSLLDTEDPRAGLNMPGKVTVTESGRIFIVCQDIVAKAPRGSHLEDIGPRMVPRYSDDGGETWTRSLNEVSYFTTGVNLAEPTIVELSDGRLKMFGRGDGGFLWETESLDGGVTWDTQLKTTMLTSTLCAFMISRDPVSGYHYIFWNYDNVNGWLPEQFPEWQWEYYPWRQLPRRRSALAVSRDDTETWEFLATVHSSQGVAVEDKAIDMSTYPGWTYNHYLYQTSDFIYCSLTGCVIDGYSSNYETPIFRFDKRKLCLRPTFPGTH